MSLILVTNSSNRSTLNINEDFIVKMYPKGSLNVIEYVESESGIIKVISVDETLSSLFALTSGLIQTTMNGNSMYLNEKYVVSVTEVNSLAIVTYDGKGDSSESLKLDVDKATFLASMPVSKIPLQYKVLLSQNAPIAAKTSGTLTVGQIWTLTTYVAGDDFSNMELLSGTVNTSGSTFRATSTTPTTWTNSSSLDYDGSPYIVSTDINGDFNPVIDSINDNIQLLYDSEGNCTITRDAGFDQDKTFVTLTNTYTTDSDTRTYAYCYNDGSIYIETFTGTSTYIDGQIYYATLLIEINP